jgi:hypothetical protein
MQAQEALEKYFGFREFREPQSEIIAEVLAGNDVFVVMPTGGGKSRTLPDRDLLDLSAWNPCITESWTVVSSGTSKHRFD